MAQSQSLPGFHEPRWAPIGLDQLISVLRESGAPCSGEDEAWLKAPFFEDDTALLNEAIEAIRHGRVHTPRHADVLVKEALVKKDAQVPADGIVELKQKMPSASPRQAAAISSPVLSSVSSVTVPPTTRGKGWLLGLLAVVLLAGAVFTIVRLVNERVIVVPANEKHGFVIT
jgi:hypothetical protein